MPEEVDEQHFQNQQILGEGVCGVVEAVQDNKGRWFAAKKLNAMAVNRQLLQMVAERASQNLSSKEAALFQIDWNSSPATVLMPLYANQAGFTKSAEDARTIQPRSLQRELKTFLKTDQSWTMVNQIGKALEKLHRARIAHGNLKPGNVFFDDDGGTVLTDGGQGVMPGVSHLSFTDAVLYAPPEQLLRPEQYFEEKGYEWDVYAFGTLAYRLINGSFPRCDKNFTTVSPKPGEDRVMGFQADFDQIASGLNKAEAIQWSLPAVDDIETRKRAVIERCLKLDPQERYSSMVEVMQALQHIEIVRNMAVKRQQENTAVADDKAELEVSAKRAITARKRARMLFSIAAVVAAVSALGWGITEVLRRHQATKFEEQVTRVKTERDRSQDAAVAAESSQAEAEGKLRSERMGLLKQLRAERHMSEQLFSYALENGSKRLPSLEGRKERLLGLKIHLQTFINRYTPDPRWKSEVDKAKMQLIDIHLASGDVISAENALEKFVKDHSLPKEDLLRMRALLGMLQSERGMHEKAKVNLSEVLNSVDKTTRNSHQLRCAAAILLAKGHIAKNKPAESRSYYAMAMKELKELGQLHPSLIMPKAELARVQLEDALVAEGQEQLGDAQLMRQQAAAGYAELVEKHPEFSPGKIELARIYRSLAEGALLEGEKSIATVEISEAKELLESVSGSGNTVLVIEKAAVLGVEAMLLRDRGKRTLANKKITTALRSLDELFVANAETNESLYRRSLLLMIRAAIAGEGGDHEQELSLGKQAFDLLVKLEKTSKWTPLRKRSVLREMAIAAGDLGHAATMAKDSGKAKAWLVEAVNCWSKLAQMNPLNEEYLEGKAWCEMRLKEIQ